MVRKESSTGMGVDAQGGPVIDPTENVTALVKAGLERQDDLRRMESAHVRELIKLHADFAEQLQDKEAKRLDAIRVVDVNAVTRAAEVSATQAATLATQVATSAETLRTQVQVAAQAANTALTAALEPIQKDIADLRRVQYEQQGQKAATVETRGSNQWAVGFALSVALALVSFAGLIIVLVGK